MSDTVHLYSKQQKCCVIPKIKYEKDVTSAFYMFDSMLIEIK